MEVAGRGFPRTRTAGKVRRAINNSARTAFPCALGSNFENVCARQHRDDDDGCRRHDPAASPLEFSFLRRRWIDDPDPSGIYCVPRNYSGIGKHLDLEFVDRYLAPLFRHCFARERVGRSCLVTATTDTVDHKMERRRGTPSRLALADSLSSLYPLYSILAASYIRITNKARKQKREEDFLSPR